MRRLPPTIIAIVTALLTVPAATTAAPNKIQESSTYAFTEPLLERNITFTVPANWHLLRHTISNRNLSRDGDVYDFQIASTKAHASKKEDIAVTLLVASGSQIAVFRKTPINQYEKHSLEGGRICYVESVTFGGGTRARNVWTRVGNKIIIINIEARAAAMKQHQNDIQAIIASLSIVPKSARLQAVRIEL